MLTCNRIFHPSFDLSILLPTTSFHIVSLSSMTVLERTKEKKTKHKNKISRFMIVMTSTLLTYISGLFWPLPGSFPGFVCFSFNCFPVNDLYRYSCFSGFILEYCWFLLTLHWKLVGIRFAAPREDTAQPMIWLPSTFSYHDRKCFVRGSGKIVFSEIGDWDRGVLFVWYQ